jgi:hypothetical protein
VARISQIVKDMHKDGTLSKLSKKWYGTDLTVKKDTSTSTTTTTSAY